VIGHEGEVLVRFAMYRYNAARLEVNHKVPILGRHGQSGCHHHLDGVETLCRRCHLVETARQFGHRIAKPAEVSKVPQLFDVA
jgi:hypothetical protein